MRIAVRGRLAALHVMLAIVAATMVSSPAPALAGSATEDQIKHAMTVALRQLGDPYVYGDEGPDSFDCSGLVQFAYGKAGVVLPRVSSDQARFFDRLPYKRDIRVGDLMAVYDNGGVYHVGLWTGRWENGRRLMLHASRTGTPVKIDAVWTKSWFAGTLRTP